MFITLKRTAAITNNVKIYTKTFAGLLAGTITTVNDLDSSLFDSAHSLFETGSYGNPTPWNIVYDNSTLTSSGYILLTKPSANTTKTNYLKIGYDLNGLYFYIGSGISANNLINPVTLGYTIRGDAGANDTFYIRIGTNFFHYFSTSVDTTTYYEAMVFEFNNNDYDTYSEEGSLKLLVINSTPTTNLISLGISMAYNPAIDTYVTTKTILIPYNLTLAQASTIGMSRGSNLTDTNYLLIPLIFNDLSTGAILGNISQSTGLYLTTSGNVISGQTITIGTDVYQVDTNTVSDLVLLAKK